MKPWVVYRCPLCGTRREYREGTQAWHPCPRVKVKKGRGRFVELVRDDDAA